MDPNTIVCPQCHNPASNQNFFCPSCGYKLKEPTPSTSIGRQIGLYLFSFFLPPFGLIPAFKYLKQPDSSAQRVGIIMIGVTVLSFVLTLIFTMQAVNLFNKQVGPQLKEYQNIVY